MSQRDYLPIEDMELFEKFESVADWVWEVVKDWLPFARDTVGKQLVRAADSIGANLVEGDGRYTDNDSNHFFVIARASARETRLWLRRSIKRGLISQADAELQLDSLTNAARMLNRLITVKRRHSASSAVRERRAPYLEKETDPLVDDQLSSTTFQPLNA